MTGMDTLIAVRKSGYKPSAVVVDLVHSIAKYDAEIYSFDERSGIVSINIAASESFNDIDLRPLVGLMVMVHDNTDNTPRFRRLCALIAKADAAHVVMPVWNGDALTVHQRWAGNPPRIESYSA